ncbi:hypothetical protein BH18ACT13_BH18ACT13_19110 [soil metagenome]
MPDHLTLEIVDEDVAMREAREGTSESRANFLKKAVFAGGTLTLGGIAIGGLPALSFAQPSPSQDVQVLNFALTLEYLEAAFYTQARNLTGETREFARVVGAHERQHVAFLKKALGAKAVKSPTFDFGNTVTNQARFQATAVVLEDTGVAAYNGQGPRVTKPVLAAAGSIVSVEARHAAWIRDIVNQNPAPKAFDQAQSMSQILAAVRATGFIQG